MVQTAPTEQRQTKQGGNIGVVEIRQAVAHAVHFVRVDPFARIELDDSVSLDSLGNVLQQLDGLVEEGIGFG